MSMTKRWIDEQMEMGNDVLHPSFEDEMLDAQYEEYKREMELQELKDEVFQKEIEEKDKDSQ